ncbi:MAG: TIM barrel protein [Opitutales bacterium]|nr:TIM barrel protein [Opitutales bacterium]
MKASKVPFFLILATSLVFQSFAGWKSADRFGVFCFDFARNGDTAEEQLETMRSIGFDGLVMRTKTPGDLKQLKLYADFSKTEEFEIYAGYLPTANIAKLDFAFVNQLISELSAVGASLWLIVNDAKAIESDIERLITDLADRAMEKGVELVLYPHDNTRIESAEEGLQWIHKLDHENLFVSFHLCHEIRAGNLERIDEVLEKIYPYLRLASISGATSDYEDGSKDWSDVIKPLNEGDVDVEPALRALAEKGYEGPVVLHTFGLKDSDLNHHERSYSVFSEWSERIEAPEKPAFDAPENAHWHEASQSWFVSNLGGGLNLSRDNYGWVTRLDESGEVVDPQWVEGLDAPTGMDDYEGILYVGDRGYVTAIDIETGRILKKIVLPGAEFVNDVAISEDGQVFVSDTFGNQIFQFRNLGPAEVWLKTDELNYPNGLWVVDNRLTVATWGNIVDPATFGTDRLGTLKSVDLESKELTELADGRELANFDGVVRYKDSWYGTFWTEGQLLRIDDKGNATPVLTGFNQLADLGINENDGQIGLVEMSKDRFLLLDVEGLQD